MEDMTLYQINQLIARLLTLPDNDGKVDSETGEYFDVEALNELDMAKKEKIEACLLFCKDRDAKAKALGDEIEALKARKEAYEHQSQRTKSYVELTLDGEKFETAKVVANFKRTTATPKDIDIEKANLPVEYIKIIPEEKKVDKAKLLKDLRALDKAKKPAKIGNVELVVARSMTYK